MEFRDHFPVWDKLTAAERQRLSDASFSRSAEKGTVLHDGSDCTGLLLIRSGRIRGYILSPEGREITIYRLFERDICMLSASCIMNSLQFDITIETEADTELWVIPPDAFRDVMQQSAPLANYMNEIMGTRLSEAMWRIEQILWKSMDKRIAAFLLEESVIEESTALHITHETIANHLGTHREVVTRLMRYFQSDGLVRLSRGTVELLDKKKLRALCDE
ncbi:MAG: Crp/Fnr family transcriptional regulator [Clostridiales bacterium]|nr:Crp/Fnr family transcriptional regulator [Clostridiales bacterium]